MDDGAGVTWGHRVVVGKTQSGKTWLALGTHADERLGIMSVFVNTKGGDHNGAPLGRRVRCGGDLVLPTVRRFGRISWEIPILKREEHFATFTDEVLRVARRVRRPWLRVFVDEAQQYGRVGILRGSHYLKGPLERLYSEGQGLGVEVWSISQRPVGFHGAVRDNVEEAYVFRCTDEAKKAMSRWGWPVESWEEWIGKPHHFVGYDGNVTRYYLPRTR